MLVFGNDTVEPFGNVSVRDMKHIQEIGIVEQRADAGYQVPISADRSETLGQFLMVLEAGRPVIPHIDA